jgi:hypothetical protein
MSAVLASECRSPECMDVAGRCGRKEFCAGRVIPFPVAPTTPTCLLRFESLSHSIWGDGYMKRIRLVEDSDLLYGVRMWDEAHKRWVYIEAQKLKPEYFREDGEGVNRLCRNYARIGIFSFYDGSNCQLQGADIVALLGDGHCSPTELDIFGWEALLLGYVRREQLPSNWRSQDMTMSHVRSLLA